LEAPIQTPGHPPPTFEVRRVGGFEFLLNAGTGNVKGLPPFAKGRRRTDTHKVKDEFKNKAKIKDEGKTTSNTKHHKMNCPSGIIASVERPMVGSTDAKGQATRR
jgi:hypothetical protein